MATSQGRNQVCPTQVSAAVRRRFRFQLPHSLKRRPSAANWVSRPQQHRASPFRM